MIIGVVGILLPQYASKLLLLTNIMQLLILLFALLIANPASALTYLVEKTGSDANDCTQAQSVSTPKLTIASARTCISTTVGAGAGHVIQVGAGVWTETYDDNLALTPSGASFANPFMLIGKPGVSVTWRYSGEFNIRLFHASPKYVIISGFIFDGVNTTSGAGQLYFGSGGAGGSYVRLLNNELINNVSVGVGIGATSQFTEIVSNRIHGGNFGGTGGGGGDFAYPIYCEGQNLLIDQNEIYDFPSWGVHCFSGIGIGPNDITISNNNIHHFGSCNRDAIGPGDGRESGIVAYGSGVQIFNNIINCGTSGIGLSSTASGAKIYSNTIYNMSGSTPGAGAWGCIESNHSGADITNNVCDQITLTYITGGIPANNAGPEAGDGISVIGNLRFADPSNGDFRPCTGAGLPHASCAGISSLIEAGANLGAPYNVDIVGTTRPAVLAWTIGAYEAGPPSAACMITPALVAQYSFDGVITDTSGNGNDATLGTGVTYGVGKYSQGAHFAGSGAVTAPDGAFLHLCGGYTLAAYIEPTNTPTDFVGVITKYGEVPGFFMYSAALASSCANSGPIAGYQQGSNVFDCYATPFTPNVTVHYTETWDGTTLRKYLDGILVTSFAASAVIDDNAELLYIGGSFFGEFFVGMIDEVHIYNCALGATSVNPACAPASVPQTIADLMLTPINAVTNVVTRKNNSSVVYKTNASVVRKYGLVD